MGTQRPGLTWVLSVYPSSPYQGASPHWSPLGPLCRLSPTTQTSGPIPTSGRKQFQSLQAKIQSLTIVSFVIRLTLAMLITASILFPNLNITTSPPSSQGFFQSTGVPALIIWFLRLWTLMLIIYKHRSFLEPGPHCFCLYVHSCCNMYQYFNSHSFLWDATIWIYHTIFIHSLGDGHLRVVFVFCSVFILAINSAVMKIHVHPFV